METEKPRRFVVADLGCGATVRGAELQPTRTYAVDINMRPRYDSWTQTTYIQADLAHPPLPIPDVEVDFVYMHHVLEHIPRRIDIPNPEWVRAVAQSRPHEPVFAPPTTAHWAHLALFDEIARILVPGGRLEVCSPHLPYHTDVWRDPQHVTALVPEFWDYIAGPHVHHSRSYGLRSTWRKLTQDWEGANLRVVLQVVK